LYHIYTHNDLDGVGCGILAKLAFGDRADVHYNSVASLDQQVKRYLDRLAEAERDRLEGEFLFITDLSVGPDMEAAINRYWENGGRAMLIDHHKSAIHLNQYPWASVRVEEQEGRLASATSLFYDFLVRHYDLKRNETLDTFVELVRQYDTWEWEARDNAQAKRLNDLFFLLSIDEFEEMMTERIGAGEPFGFSEFENRLLDLEESKIERYLRRKKKEVAQTSIHDHTVGVVHAESYHSELGNELGKTYRHLDYIAIVSMGSRRIGFRTIHDDVDVSAVAGSFGGGGHAKAAGCVLTPLTYPLFVEAPFKVEPLVPDADRNRYNVKDSRRGTLYGSRDGRRFVIYRPGEEWVLETLDGAGNTARYFPSFADAERELKRHEMAYLLRDGAYVSFLADQFLAGKSERPAVTAGV